MGYLQQKHLGQSIMLVPETQQCMQEELQQIKHEIEMQKFQYEYHHYSQLQVMQAEIYVLLKYDCLDEARQQLQLLQQLTKIKSPKHMI